MLGIWNCIWLNLWRLRALGLNISQAPPHPKTPVWPPQFLDSHCYWRDCDLILEISPLANFECEISCRVSKQNLAIFLKQRPDRWQSHFLGIMHIVAFKNLRLRLKVAERMMQPLKILTRLVFQFIIIYEYDFEFRRDLVMYRLVL